jgi:hypothetical protein
MISKFLDHRAGDLSRIGKPLRIVLCTAMHTGSFCGVKAQALSEAAATAVVIDDWRRLIDWVCFEVWNVSAAVADLEGVPGSGFEFSWHPRGCFRKSVSVAIELVNSQPAQQLWWSWQLDEGT